MYCKLHYSCTPEFGDKENSQSLHATNVNEIQGENLKNAYSTLISEQIQVMGTYENTLKKNYNLNNFMQFSDNL